MSKLAILIISLSILFTIFALSILVSRYAYKRAFYFPPTHPVLPFFASNEDEEEILKGLNDSSRLLCNEDYEPIFIESFETPYNCLRWYSDIQMADYLSISQTDRHIFSLHPLAALPRYCSSYH